MKVLIWCRDHIRFLVCLLFCLLLAVVLTSGEYTGRKAVFSAGGRAMGGK